MLRRGLLQVLQRASASQITPQLVPAAGQLVQSIPPPTAALPLAAIQQLWHVPASLCLQQQQQHQQLHTSAAVALQHHVQLNSLRPASGSRKTAIRVGRGDGGGRGTYCGRGVKGQKARKGGKPHLLFDGGQKQLKKYPKVGLTPSSPVLFRQVGLSKVLRWVELGLLDATQVITMKDLRDSGCASKIIRWGVELVANGRERVALPLHLQVSSVSPQALRLVERAGGSVTRVYYTPLGLRALLKPENFGKKGRMLPRPVRAWPPRDNGKYDVVGQLPPERLLPEGGTPPRVPVMGTAMPAAAPRAAAC